MTSRPWMPLYIADYRADTAQLSTEQHGAYLLLLMSMWVGGGYLPDDSVKLARVSGLSLKRWKSIAADILPLFMPATEGRITHKRVRRELAKIGAVTEVRKEAGRKGGHARAFRAGTSQIDSTRSAAEQHAPDKQLTLLDDDQAIAKSAPSKNGNDSRAHARLDTHTHNQTKEDSLRSDERSHDAEFAEWYRHYPLKRARGQAERAFRAARKIAGLQELIDGVERYRREKRADRDWRYPATWLNGKGWLDEPEPQSPMYQSTGPPVARQSREDAERAAWNKVLDDAAKGKSNG